MTQDFYHLAELFFWMFGAFIIGLVFGKIRTKKSSSQTVDTDAFFEEIGEEDFSKIRATKTFGRGGKEMVAGKTQIKEEINIEPDTANIEKDDLKKIQGIGAVKEAKLNELGIYKYEQVAKLSDKDIQHIATEIQFSYERIIKEDWIGQAIKKTKS